MSPFIENISLENLPGAAPAWRARVDENGWRRACESVSGAGGRLGALWASDERDRAGSFIVHALLVAHEGLVCLDLPVQAQVPDLSDLFPAAGRMQRAMRDLMGLPARADARGWRRPGGGGGDCFPLRRGVPAPAGEPAGDGRYAFVPVEGEGVHEIPVGPVRAGITEPGHFRFSVVGERVLRLEERLGYTHKGADKRFEDFAIADGYRVAGRICGDSTVAFAWAYAQAAESLAGIEAPPRARCLRALMLERERVANHLGDLGALGNDAAFCFALSQFMRVKEDWLRLNLEAFGHRLLMDRVVPGGVDAALDGAMAARLQRQADEVEAEGRVLHEVFDEHSGLQDRFITAGRVTPDLARVFGLAGLAGRASRQAFDLRADFPCDPYARLAVEKAVYPAGDVAARVKARFDELYESVRLIRRILHGMPAGETRRALPAAAPGAFGVGWVEGWRGEVLVALEAGAAGGARRGPAHAPPWVRVAGARAAAN